MQTSAAAVDSDAEIEAALASLARMPGGGFVVMSDAFTGIHRQEIVALAARYRLPAVYPFRWFADIGGLLAYGIDSDETCRQAAAYVDRILRGAKPADLPVQAPVKYEMIINLKTARTLGLAVPDNLLAIADEVIE
jgi:putative ABC transport system substrate-binding protein